MGIVGCGAGGGGPDPADGAVDLAMRDLAAPADLARQGDFAIAPADLAMGPVDLPAMSGDMAVAPPADLAGRDLTSPADLSLPPADLAQPAEVTFSSAVTQLFQNCQPIVAPDPLRLEGTLTVVNSGAAPAGPYEARTGAVTDEKTVFLASFDIAPIGPFMVPAKGQVSFPVKKTAGTLMPASGCKTLSCGSNVRLVVYVTSNGPLAGKGISLPVVVQCAF